MFFSASTTAKRPTRRLAGLTLTFFASPATSGLTRGAKKRPVLLGDDQPDAIDSAPSPVEQVDLADRAAQLRQWVAELDPEAHELVELAVLQQLPYREISEILGIPVGTVKSRVFYTLRRLREQASAIDPNTPSEGSP
jgi:RNA polymerase sigma-70 factor (ECF subfamily)